MSCQGTWADAIMIQAVANCLNLFIHIAVITIATFTSGIHRLAITTRARNLNIWRQRVFVKSYLGEGVRVTFCLRSLATQGELVNTRNVATERLAKSDKLSENLLTSSSVSDLTILE